MFGCKDAHPNLWSVFFRLGGVGGGDELYEIEYDDGSTASLRAGNGLYVLGGAQVTPLRIGRHSLTLAFEGGLKRGYLSEDDGSANVDITFRRASLTPRLQYGVLAIEPMGMHFIVGGGPSWDINAQIEAQTRGFSPDLDERFDLGNALGGVLETGLWFDGGFIGVDVTFRYTYMKYDGIDAVEPILGHGFGAMIGILGGTPKPLRRSERGPKQS